MGEAEREVEAGRQGEPGVAVLARRAARAAERSGAGRRGRAAWSRMLQAPGAGAAASAAARAREARRWSWRRSASRSRAHLPAPQMVNKPRTQSTSSSGMGQGRQRSWFGVTTAWSNSAVSVSAAAWAQSGVRWQSGGQSGGVAARLGGRCCLRGRPRGSAPRPQRGQAGQGAWQTCREAGRRAAARLHGGTRLQLQQPDPRPGHRMRAHPPGKLRGWKGSCVTEGRMRYSQDRRFCARGAVKAVPLRAGGAREAGWAFRVGAMERHRGRPDEPWQRAWPRARRRGSQPSRRRVLVLAKRKPRPPPARAPTARPGPDLLRIQAIGADARVVLPHRQRPRQRLRLRLVACSRGGAAREAAGRPRAACGGAQAPSAASRRAGGGGAASPKPARYCSSGCPLAGIAPTMRVGGAVHTSCLKPQECRWCSRGASRPPRTDHASCKDRRYCCRRSERLQVV